MAVSENGVWVLSLLGVHPHAQGEGLGRRLFDAAIAYGEGCRGFMIGASERPEAIGLYARAGFRVHPCLTAKGAVRRKVAPELPAVRAGEEADVAGHCSDVDRAVRGGARPRALRTLWEMGFRLWVTPSGYAFGADDGLRVLAAGTEEEAAQLLWRVLADTREKATVGWLDGRQEWAFRVVLDAGLALETQGPLLVPRRARPAVAVDPARRAAVARPADPRRPIPCCPPRSCAGRAPGRGPPPRPRGGGRRRAGSCRSRTRA